jgi:CRISPR-associated endonuclease/helicase Cas3
LGKYSSKFQDFIKAVNGVEAHIEGIPGRVDHSTAGSIYAIETFNKIGRVFAYLIAGHHAGLPDWQSDTSGMSGLAQRLEKKDLLKAALSSGITTDILSRTLPSERPKAGSDLSLSLWIRMLFSCLVDADFLDTEWTYLIFPAPF